MEKIQHQNLVNPKQDLNRDLENSAENSQSCKSYSVSGNSTAYHGPRPCYDLRGNLKNAYVVGICGGSASGKTTVARNITETLKAPWMTTLNLDSFYKELTREEHEASNRMEYDFDHPNAIDFVLAAETLKSMKMGKTVWTPIWDFGTHSRAKNKSNIIYGANVIIVEGLMTFYPPELLELFDLKIFVDTDSDLRLCRRVIRDIEERGRDLPSVLLQYSKFVKPNFDKFIAPLVDLADIVIPWNSYNNSAIDVISKLIKRNLENRGFVPRCGLIPNYQENVEVHDKIHFIEQTNQVKVLQTIIRDCKTDRLTFCHHSRRLIKLCLAEALSLIDFPVFTSNFSEDDQSKGICAVSVLRVGQAFEDSVKELLPEYSFGKILVETNEKTNEPRFHYVKLPTNINNCHVLLFDAAITTGASALMAIKILIDHNVREEDIIMITLILTSAGVQSILNEFPNLKIVAAAIDNKINENYLIIPGFGNFGKRYHCS